MDGEKFRVKNTTVEKLLPHRELEGITLRNVKIDFLKEGADMCLMIRLYEFKSSEALRLKEAFSALADGSTLRVRLEEIVHTESVDGTHLSFAHGKWNQGVVRQNKNEFEVILTPQGWLQTADLTEPFCVPSSGYQWLTPQAGKIQLLLSVGGEW